MPIQTATEEFARRDSRVMIWRPGGLSHTQPQSSQTRHFLRRPQSVRGASSSWRVLLPPSQCSYSHNYLVRYPSMALQASSASVKEAKGEPPTLTAHLF